MEAARGPLAPPTPSTISQASSSTPSKVGPHTTPTSMTPSAKATRSSQSFSGGSEMRIVSGPTRPKDSWPSAHPPPARRELPRQRWERRRAPPPPWREQRQPASRRRPNPPALRQVWRKSCRPRGRGNFAVGGRNLTEIGVLLRQGRDGRDAESIEYRRRDPVEERRYTAARVGEIRRPAGDGADKARRRLDGKSGRGTAPARRGAAGESG